MVFLIRTDVDNDTKIKIDEGSNILGRDFLSCDDRRISSTHCELLVNDNEIVIKSLGANPCFVKTAKISDTVIISSGQDRILQKGDTFGLLPNEFWYRILTEDQSHQTDTRKVTQNLQNDNSDSSREEPTSNFNGQINEVTSDSNSGTSQAIKKDPDDGEELPVKRQRLNDPADDVKPDIDSLNSAIAESSDSADGSGVVKTEPDDSKPAAVKQDSAAADSTTPAVTSPTIPAPGPASSNGPVVRERCMYADRCYRKNTDHKRMFSHPGDPDYQQGVNLACPFGALCRRRDPRHWQDQAHPPGAKPRRKKKVSKKAASQDQLQRGDRKARKVAKKRPSWSGTESKNEYDTNDSWLTDDSDCWSPDGSSSLSDEDD